MLMKLTPGVNVTNILRETFLSESVFQSFFYLLCNFLAEEYCRKSCLQNVDEIDFSLPLFFYLHPKYCPLSLFPFLFISIFHLVSSSFPLSLSFQASNIFQPLGESKENLTRNSISKNIFAFIFYMKKRKTILTKKKLY